MMQCSDVKQSLLQLYAEAGVLYEKAENWDEAAAVYIKIKSWSVDEQIMIVGISMSWVGQLTKLRNGQFV